MIFCSLFSGSSGNSIFVREGDTSILIDAGMPGKKINEALVSINENPELIKGIFVTHEHSDHIKGVGIFSRKYNIPIYANEETWKQMYKSLGKIKEENIKVLDRRSSVKVGDLEIKSFAIPHDAVCPVGYRISSKDKRVSVATDFGVFTEEIFDNVKDSDVILLESNHDVSMLRYGPYPYSLKQRILSETGHLSNDDCGEAIVNLAKHAPHKKIILGHLSNTNNQPDLAFQTVLNVISEKGIVQGEDINLSMANRGEPSGYIEL